MQLDTAHFGNIEIDDNEIISFPEGVPGFEKSNKFVLIANNGGEDIFYWLQSVDSPELCFVVTDPFMLYDGYGVDVDDEDISILEISDPSKVLTLAIVIIPENIEETRVNLKAPILINVEKKLGKQIILNNDNLPLRYYISKEKS